MRSKYKLTGLNQLRKIKFMLSNGIKLYSIKKISADTITFEVMQDEEKKFVKFYTDKNLNIEKLCDSKYGLFKKFLKKSLVFLICFLVFFSGFIAVVNIFLFKIEVSGVNSQIESEIKASFTPFTFKGNINRMEMEKYLKAKYNEISLVSVSLKGTTLVINIKEKNETIETIFADFICPFDGVIKTINLKSGTANVKSGDNVKEGDILVRSETMVNGTLIKTNAEAEIEILASCRTNEIFKENRIELKPTGKYKDNIYWSILGKLIKLKENKKYPYYYTEIIEDKKSLFSLIPVYQKTERIYELKKVEINEVFAEKEEEIKKRVLEKAVNLSSSTEFITQNITTVKLSGGVYNVVAEVQFYAIINK